MNAYLVILFAPMFVILFWGVELIVSSFKKEPIKQNLAFFMLCGLFAIVSGIAFFLKQYQFYTNTYVLVVFFALSQIPSFYIYVHSLTRNTPFSRRIYIHYFIPFVAFLIAVIVHWVWFSSEENYRFTSEYLTGDKVASGKMNVAFIIDRSYKFTFVAFGIIYYWLINKRVKEHREKIDNYFSNTETISLNWIHIFNVLFLLTLFSGIFFHGVKREFFLKNPALISIPYGFQTLFYWVIGHFGSKQKSIYNPTEIIETDDRESNLQQNLPTNFETQLLAIMHTDRPYLNPDISLPDLAKMTGTNRTYLSKHINSNYNQNFKQYINEHRLINAEKLLMEGDNMDIMSISLQSGFSSYHTFNRCFKERYKMSPGVYRKQNNLNAK